jgi:hypothetical protein
MARLPKGLVFRSKKMSYCDDCKGIVAVGDTVQYVTFGTVRHCEGLPLNQVSDPIYCKRDKAEQTSQEQARPAVELPAESSVEPSDTLRTLADSLYPRIKSKLESEGLDVESDNVSHAELAEAISKALTEQSASFDLNLQRWDKAIEVRVETPHKQFQALCKLVEAGVFNIYLHDPIDGSGGPGSGKSTAARKLAETIWHDAEELPYGYMALGPGTMESRVFGFYNASGVYVETEF